MSGKLKPRNTKWRKLCTLPAYEERPAVQLFAAVQCHCTCRGERYQCQGIEGHPGPHWVYNQRGELIRWPFLGKNGEVIGVVITSPPGSPGYISPEVMKAQAAHFTTKIEPLKPKRKHARKRTNTAKRSHVR